MAKSNRPAAIVPGAQRMRWPSSGRLCACARTFLESYDQDFLSRLREGPSDRLLHTLRIPAGEDVFLLHDSSTVEGGAGFFLCRFGIVTKPPLRGALSPISWLTFVTGRLLPPEAEGICRLQDSLGIICPAATWAEDAVSAPEVYRFLETLQSYLRSHCGGSEVLDPQVTAELPDSVSEKALAQCARAFIINYDQNILHDIRRGNPSSMPACLGIPAGTEIFLYHDGTLQKTGGFGFAAAFSGFYCRTWCEGECVFTDWRTFYTGTLEAGPYVLRRSGSDAPLAVCGAGTRSNETFLFIARLHAHLRSQFGA